MSMHSYLSFTGFSLIACVLIRCGKLFRSNEEVEFHAAKTRHSSYSESTEEKKPLTEEEKKEQLRKIEVLMAAKRQEREEKEKAEQASLFFSSIHIGH